MPAGARPDEVNFCANALQVHADWLVRLLDAFKRILNLCETRPIIEREHGPHIRLAQNLLLGISARVGAILDLTRNRVDFERDTISLRADGASTGERRAIVGMDPAHSRRTHRGS